MRCGSAFPTRAAALGPCLLSPAQGQKSSEAGGRQMTRRWTPRAAVLGTWGHGSFSEKTPAWPQISPWGSDLEPHPICPQSLPQPPPSDLAPSTHHAEGACDLCTLTPCPWLPKFSGGPSSTASPGDSKPPPLLRGHVRAIRRHPWLPGQSRAWGLKALTAICAQGVTDSWGAGSSTRQRQSSAMPCGLGWHRTKALPVQSP